MDFNLNDDQRQFADLAQQFSTEELAPLQPSGMKNIIFLKMSFKKPVSWDFAHYIRQNQKAVWGCHVSTRRLFLSS